MQERHKSHSHFAKVSVARHLGVLAGLLLPHQARLAHHAAQREAVNVCELALAAGVVRQLQGLGQDDVVGGGEDGVGGGVGAAHLLLQRVVVDAVVDEQHALLVARVLPEAVHADRLRVHHADLTLVELGQDGQLDGAPPGVVPSYPAAVLLIGLPQHRLRVGGGVAGHDLGDEASHLWGTRRVVHAPLHYVEDAGEETGVVCGDHSPRQRGRDVQVGDFSDGRLSLRLGLVLLFLHDESVSCRRRGTGLDQRELSLFC